MNERAHARAGLALGLLLSACAGGAPEPAPAPPPARTIPVLRPGLKRAPEASPPRSWHAVRVVPDAPLLPAREVVVAPGDTLDGIARVNGAAPGALAAANGLKPPYTLVPGARLAVPAGRSHSVKPGETASSIARAYRAAFSVVARANGLKPPYALEVGDRVLIPSAPPRPTVRFKVPPRAAPSPPATVEARAQAYNLDIDKLLGKELARRTIRPGAPAAPRALSPSAEEGASAPPSGETTAKPTQGAGAALAQAPAIQLDWPLTGRILSTFGAKPGGRFNDGVNIAAVAGAPVRAAADGTVAYAGNGVAAFGGLVLVRHADGWLTAYAHCEALLVAKGDTVRRGQPIARAGATGEVDEPQLHFELRRGRTPVDPLRVLPGRGG